MLAVRRVAARAKDLVAGASEWIACIPLARKMAKADRELATAIFKRDEDALAAALAAGADPFAANPTHEGAPSLFVSAALSWASWDLLGYARVHRRLMASAQASALYAKRGPSLAWELLSAGLPGWMSAAALLRDGCGLAAPSQSQLQQKLAEIGEVGGAHARSGLSLRPDLDLLRAALSSSESASPEHQSLRQLIGRRARGPREINEVYMLAVEAAANAANPAFADLLASERLSVEQLRLVVSVLEGDEPQAPASGAMAPTAPRKRSSRELMPLCWARIEHAELSQAVAAARAAAHAKAEAPAAPTSAFEAPAASASSLSPPTSEPFAPARDSSNDASAGGAEEPARMAAPAASHAKSRARRL